ncbi:substrate-binding periplasmic protein [Thalassotalea sediminis]|uniref:substrate-binding periplasmic protein n=1 Tax=Thalassotalea sediminis TaxID=1759089 RepID=UPI0025734FE5|nr:transporter substrate-binding domain-containing protein [Thalassotalea sediminis]
MRALYTLLFLSVLTVQSNADEISIRADAWYPINGQPNSDKQGYMIDLANSVFALYGHTVDYDVAPWKRALLEVEQGIHDCVVGAYVKDAPDFTFPKHHWGLVNTGVYVLSDDPFIFTSVASLKNRQVGIITGYAYSSDEINHHINTSSNIYKAVSGKNPLQSNIKKLQHERIDTIIENPLVMAAKLKSLNISNKIKLAGTVGKQSPIYIACTPDSKRAKEIIHMIDEGTKKLRGSGEFDKILQKYGLTDWQKSH